MVLGRIVGAYGVRGWLRVTPCLEPRDALLGCDHWHLRRDGRWQPVLRAGGRVHGRGLIIALAGISDRDSARALAGCEIGVPESSLPALPEGEYYAHQLVGLEVVNRAGRRLGRVHRLMPTGAHDVLVVRDGEAERLIPYGEPVVAGVDLGAGCIRVDWEADD